MRFFNYLAILLLAFPLPAVAGASASLAKPQAAAPAPVIKIVRPPALRLPLACTVGTDCWVMNYPDAGPDGDGLARDPGCGARTYDGHKGTDIMIADAAAMRRGVDVLAAHDGTVSRVRDHEPDHFPLTQVKREEIKAQKKECGNAVLVEIGGGWQTLYCHMKSGSITVRPEQKIKAGDKIGQVGASGDTPFPHLHIGLVHDGIVIDPFTNKDITAPCGGKPASLFVKSSGVAYLARDIMKAGFAAEKITLEKLDGGYAGIDAAASDAPMLLFYAVVLGVEKGDRIALRIEDDKGRVFAERTIEQAQGRAQQLVYVGREILPEAPLPAGLYTGRIEVTPANGDDAGKISKTKELRIGAQ